jgi:hypothetical protein
MYTKRWLFFVGVIFAIAACIRTSGNKFDPQRVDELTPGVSTIGDALTILGPVSAESTYRDGSRLLQWQYTQASVVGASGAHVAVLFDNAGRMIRVTHKFSQTSR